MKLLPALPNESIYSRLIRQIMVYDIQPSVLLTDLFKRPKVALHPYLTSGLQNIAQLSNEPPLALFNFQTLGPLFCYFSRANSCAIQSAMLSNVPSDTMQVCNIASYRESEYLSLKFCPRCAREDIEKYGISFWHLFHQIPGIEACPSHKTWLIHQRAPDSPHMKANFLPDGSAVSSSCSECAFMFSTYVFKFISNFRQDTNKISHQSISTALSKFGYVTKTGRFKLKKISADLHSLIGELKYPNNNFLPKSIDDLRYLSYFFSNDHAQHPFKFLLLSFWLDRKTKFEYKNKHTTINNNIQTKEVAEEVKHLCISLLYEGESLAEIEKLTSKSRCYIKRLAQRENIPISLKPRILTANVCKSIIEMARKGFHRRIIAKQYNVSIGSVESIISSVVGLTEFRRQCKFESSARRHKANILRALQNNPGYLIRDIKNQCSAAYYWLFRNDKQWLQSNMSSPKPPPIWKGKNWNQRDISTAFKIHSFVATHGSNYSRTKLEMILNCYGWLTRMKHRLPLSMNVLGIMKRSIRNDKHSFTTQ